MLDEERFLGPHGIRSLSKWHLEHPYDVRRRRHRSTGCSTNPPSRPPGMFGGNSNWRGPVWFPVNVLIIRALLQHYQYYGDDFRIECPTGSGHMMTLFEVAKEISDRLVGTFLPDDDGRRPVYGGTEKFQTDPHWRDLISFYEYFHGDNGAGLGASHQTGWTGVVARLIQSFGELDAATFLRIGGRPLARPYRRPRRRARRRERPTVSWPARSRRPRDLHLGVARRPEPRRRTAPSRWPTCPTPCGTTSPDPGSTRCG